MRLAEMTELPTRAGQAELVFVDPEDNKTIFGRDYFPLPSRRENRIFLLQDSEYRKYEFTFLRCGQQFIFCDYYDGLSEYVSEYGWFGGWDESSAFLTEVTQEAFDAYEDNGEQGFYDYLKPEAIRFLEKHTGRSSLRQGDIFLFPLDISWEMVTGLSLAFVAGLGVVREIKPIEVNEHPVLGTRHQFTGIYEEHGYLIGEHFPEVAGWPISVAFASHGVLEAPDHKPVAIQAVHLIQQARGLFDPAAAD